MEDFLNLRGQNLRLLKMYFLCQTFHTQVVQVYLQQFLHNSLLKCASQLGITKNSLKTPRSSMLTPLRSSSLELVMISRMSLPIGNCFYAR